LGSLKDKEGVCCGKERRKNTSRSQKAKRHPEVC
jgi:hypothetical protein